MTKERMTKDEALLKLALEALEAMNPYPASKEEQRNTAITAIKEALAQQDVRPTNPLTDEQKQAMRLLALEALTSGDGWRQSEAIKTIEEVLAQPPEERNFCPRCGKRAGKNAWDVHTCSLPEEKNT